MGLVIERKRWKRVEVSVVTKGRFVDGVRSSEETIEVCGLLFGSGGKWVTMMKSKIG